jgi:hypothetical protein
MHLSDETGSVYVRYGLLPQGLLPNLNLYDQLNRSIKIDLASVPFALQLRKELLSTVLAEMKDPEEAKLLLSALLDLIQLEQSKGFVSDDYAFTLNFGYANRKVVRIDLGGYAPFHAKFSLMRASKPIKRWLKKNYRLLVPWFEQEVASRERCSS